MKCAEGDYEMHLELLFKHLWSSVQYLSAHKLQPYSSVKTFSQSRNGLRINGDYIYSILTATETSRITNAMLRSPSVIHSFLWK